MGYAKTREDVLKIVHSAVLKKGKEMDKISPGWWNRFCKRWPQLRLHKEDSFLTVKDQATSYAVFKNEVPRVTAP